MMQLAPRTVFVPRWEHFAQPQHRLRGLGAGPSTNQIIGATTSAGGAIASVTLAPTVAATLGIAAAAAVPIIGAAVALIGFGIEALVNSGCGQTCIVTSNWANQAEGLLQDNVKKYLAVPAPRPASVQAAALANFDTVWNYLVQECSQPGLGTAGQNCIADRQAGACKWQSSPGVCFNWFSGYRDPIATDPQVISDDQYAALQAAAATGSTPPAVPAGSPQFLPAISSGAAVVPAGSNAAAAISAPASNSMLWVLALGALALYVGGGN